MERQPSRSASQPIESRSSDEPGPEEQEQHPDNKQEPEKTDDNEWLANTLLERLNQQMFSFIWCLISPTAGTPLTEHPCFSVAENHLGTTSYYTRPPSKLS